jgi:two-component system, cell cycle sensor histidine kinase and response regulator CckA
MQDRDKTKEQLIDELRYMHERVSVMEATEARLRGTEKALRESEERFRLLYENAPLGYQSLDENGHFLEVNRAWLDTLGYEREEVIGRWFGDFLAPGYQDHFKINFPKFKAAGEIHWVEFEMLRKDGSQVSVAFDGQIGRDEQGRFRQTHCILHDISEIKRSQDALKESEQRYRAVVDNIEVGISVLNSQMKIVGVNKALKRYFPHVQPGCGQICYEQLNDPPRSAPCSYCPCVITLQDGQVHEAITETPAGLEIRHYRRVSSPMKDSDGRVEYVVELTEDITERKKAQESLDRANQEWERTFNAISDLVMVLDDKHKILRANKAMAEALGMTEQELIGKLCFELVHGENEPPVFCPHSRLLTDGEEHSAEVVEPRLGGIYDVRVSPLIDQNGQVMGSVHVTRDITERRRVEKALRDSEERLRLTLEATRIGIWDWDVETDQWYASPTYYTMLGYEPSTGLGDRGEWLERVHPDDRAHVNEKIQDVLTKDFKEYQYDARLRHADGAYRWQHVQGVGIKRAEDGKVTRILGIRMDITERRRAEEALRESEDKYRTLFEESFDGLFVTSPGGKILDMNKKGVAMFGYDTKEEILSLDLERDVYARPPDRSRILAMVNAQGNAEYEVIVKKKNGEEMITHCVLTAVKDEQGVITAYRGIIRDITELAQVRLRLENERVRLRTLVQTIPDLVWLKDPDGIYLTCNPRFERLFGAKESDIVGKTDYDFVDADLADFFRDHDLKAMDAGKPSINEEWITFADDGHRELLETVKTPMYDNDGSLVGVLGIARNITAAREAEEALEAAGLYNRSLIEASLDPLVTISPEGKITDVNTATERVTGYSRKDLIGTDFANYFTDPEKARTGYQEAFQVGSVSDYELQIRHREGGLTPVMYNASVYYDHYGNVAGLFAAARNITKQQTAEKALRESEEQYRAVFHNAGIGIKVVNWDGRINRANPALLSMLGYSEAEFRELTPMDITHPDDRRMTNEYLDAVLGDGPDTLRLQKRYMTKAGSVIWGDVSISAMRDAQGKRITALEVIADITDRTKSQIALQESEIRLRRIIDSSPVGIRITQEGGHVYANRALAAIFGYESPEEILGLPAEALFAADSRELIRQRMADRVEGKTIPRHYEASGITKHGKTVALESWGTEIDYLGKKSWLAFIIDVSEAKSLRAQLLQAQKMEAVGTLAGGIAHDFNNILQVVLGFSEMILMSKEKGDPDYEDLEKILSAAGKGANLVKGLLAFGRKAEINPKPLSLNQVIHQTEAILARTIPKTIKIDLILQERLSAINADPFQIEQILLNLAINARDAMPEGGTLTFETSSVSLDETYCIEHLGAEPGEYVLLRVSDTGVGMTNQTLEHIFEPFFSTKPAGAGTGLGLAIVYGIVKQHSGLIRAYSEPGAGTTFKLYFPVIEMKDETRVREEVVRFPGGTETILLVDDEDLVRELAKRILGRAGYSLLAATNGREALHVYGKELKRISLVLLDLIMPEMDGKQCLKELLKLNPGAKVLVASGYSADGSTNEALEGGARGFVSKPFDMGQLLQTVRKVLDET